jgi:gluconate 2-dehydrogenase gamma chain
VHRRDLLRLLGGVSILAGLDTEQLLALGQATHRRLKVDRSPLGFFDVHQMHTVAAAGERILPATDTPGALAAECHRFTERIVAAHYGAERQRRFLSGLTDVDRRSAAMHQRLFIELEPPAQDAVLAAVEADAYAAVRDGADSFWRDLKYLTLYGYYTSEIGIEEELKTNHAPGRFEGAAPVTGGPS